MEASSFYMEMDSNDLNSASSDQFFDCFFKPNTNNPNWETSDPFESALSSMVSSPATATNSGAGDGVVIRELIGRLGNICNNSGEVSNNNSCYNTPLNSPPKLNLSAPKLPLSGALLPPAMAAPAPFAGDPGFAERAAKNSLFGAAQFGLREPEFGPKPDSGKTAGLGIRPAATEKRGGRGAVAEIDSREGSSVSDQIPIESDGNAKKRKASQRAAKAKEVTHSPKVKDVVANANKDAAEKNEESNAKKTKKDGNESGDGNEKQTKESSKAAEPPKDYIHVRARRGQATDSHSLAERVRREKISERMKFLQDLVPGCNKVTGKAVMLDEIINYVQSLQRQVEFLSMKLATVNPRMDINIEALLSKDIFQSRGSLPHGIYPLDTSSLPTFPFGYQNHHHHHQAQNLPQLNNTIANDQTQFPLNTSNAQPMHRVPTIQLPAIDGFPESTQQVSTFFEDDLQSLVQMGFGQIQQSFQGSLASTQMKVEL